MFQKRYSLAATDAERPVLAPGWLILAMCLLVTGVLVALYPMQELERRLEGADGELASTYLDNLLLSDPDNPRLRMLMARAQIRLGETLKVREILQPLVQSPDVDERREALWVLWEMYLGEQRQWEKRQKAWPPNRQAEVTAAVSDLHEEMRAAMHQIAAIESLPERLLSLASKAHELHENLLSAQIYRRIGEAMGVGEAATRFYEHAARQMLAVGDYEGAASIYLLAKKSSRDYLQGRHFFHTAVRTLQSGNLLEAALRLAEEGIPEYINDSESLIFIINLARSAGRPDVAERYVRLLLRLAMERQWWLAEVERAWGPGHFRPVNNQAMTSFQPGIPYDEKIFNLAYEVFLENGKLDDAWKLAKFAVDHAKEKKIWRQRLAQVSEWHGKPIDALQQWRLLAQETGEDAAWQAVLRLAPGLFDDEALLPALHYQLQQKPGDKGLIRQIVDANIRLAEPKRAIEFLAEQYRRQPDGDYLDWQASIAEDAGLLDDAVRYWQQLFADSEQLTPQRAMQAAVLLFSMARGQEALPWLAAARGRVGEQSEEDVEYWRLSGQAALMYGETALAIEAFEHLIRSPDAEITDFDVLTRLLIDTQPELALQLSVEAWEKFDQPRYFMQALTLASLRQDLDRIDNLLARLDASSDAGKYALAPFLDNPEFYRIVGSQQQMRGKLAEARRTYQQGLQRLPGSAALRQALLWLLVDSRDVAALRELLAVHEPQWAQDREMHDTLAAAYQVLSLPQIALDRYLQPRLNAHRDDFLWLMAYADALDQNQQSDQAWRLRQQLLLEAWQQHRAAGQGETLGERRSRWLTEQNLDAVRRQARARLLMTQHKGDAGFSALRELLRLDRQGREKLSDAAAETAIGWLQEAGEHAAERAMLWEQYSVSQSRPKNRPLWAEITLALVDHDTQAAGDLLLRYDAMLPRYDRVNAAQMLGDTRQAQTAAFESATWQIDDTPMQMQLSDSLLAFSDHLAIGVKQQALGSIDERVVEQVWHVAVNPRLSLDFALQQTRRAVADPQTLRRAVNENSLALTASYRSDWGNTRVHVAGREAARKSSAVDFEHELRLDRRLALRLAVGFHLPTQESLGLRMAGMKDRYQLGLTLRPTRQDAFQIDYRVEKYALQNGTPVGRGRHLDLSFSHALRQDTPDLEVGLFWSRHAYERESDFSASGFNLLSEFLPAAIPSPVNLGSDYFLPEDFSLSGVRLSSNMRYAREYTRAVRPYGSVARTWHSRTGGGYDVRLGVAGSVVGADRLGLDLGVAKSGAQSAGLVKDVQFNYRLHF